MSEPLRFGFDVACAADEAFRSWTEHIAAWWPRGHSSSGDPDTTVIIEPGVGGRLLERTSAGEEIVWGAITAWEPPRRFAYLWHIGRSPDQGTDVEIRFVETGGTTRVEIEHGGWERLGDEGPAWREGNTRGWQRVLDPYNDYCAARAAGTEER